MTNPKTGNLMQRIEDVERQLSERGATQRDLEPFRRMRASALVSLAVNANVRMGAPEKARDHGGCTSTMPKSKKGQWAICSKTVFCAAP